MIGPKELLAAASPHLYEVARLAKRRMSRLWRSQTYQQTFADQAMRLSPVTGRRVLVVGANNGSDCRPFVEGGAAEVHGLDVIKSIGSDFGHARVTYHQAAIEKSNLPTGYFDLVVAFDTMEHVGDIDSGFREMARLTAPGGLIFTVSDPLWQSPYGHHMRCFDGHPWIHMALERDEIFQYAEAHGILRDGDLAGTVGYMLNPEFFNQRPGADFIEVCSNLPETSVTQNDLTFEPQSLLHHPFGQMALRRGYVAKNLLATTHTLIAHKVPH